MLSKKVRKILLRKPKEIGCSESRIWLLNARWKESCRVLRTIERTENLFSERDRGDRVLRERNFDAQCEMEREL